jgi:hypothetical protein
MPWIVRVGVHKIINTDGTVMHEVFCSGRGQNIVETTMTKPIERPVLAFARRE